MATKLTQVARSCIKNGSQTRVLSNTSPVFNQTRCISQNATTINGAIPPEPLKKKFSIPKVLLCMGAGTFVGQYIAKSFAAFLEETEMFVPEDDDD